MLWFGSKATENFSSNCCKTLKSYLTEISRNEIIYGISKLPKLLCATLKSDRTAEITLKDITANEPAERRRSAGEAAENSAT